LSKGFSASIAVWVLLALSGSAPPALAQGSFSSGSDGSCGAYDLTGTPSGTTVTFSASNFTNCDHLANNVFDFTYITIPAGVAVQFTENAFHGPVFWLAQSDVTISGTLNLNGSNGELGCVTDATIRNIPAAGGSGGYAGGIGGSTGSGIITQPGGGPGGGATGKNGITSPGNGFLNGTNLFLIPLVGGSGGGGGQISSGEFGGGGGAGGGAILIASSTQVIVSGGAVIEANGGGGGQNCGGQGGGGGSGGAIHLLSNTISGSGSLLTTGGGGTAGNGGGGIVRLEAFTKSFSGGVSGTYTQSSEPSSALLALSLPSAPAPYVRVTSINGTPITENPFSFPDITINTSSSIPLVITASQIPAGTVPTVWVFSESGDQQLTCSGGLQLDGTNPNDPTETQCTINLTFNFGGSRGTVRATWTPTSAPTKK
jgi:hypothetical protein